MRQIATTAAARSWPSRLNSIAIFCRCAVVVLLVAQLLFAHGCHGDEDHELFSAIQQALTMAP